MPLKCGASNRTMKYALAISLILLSTLSFATDNASDNLTLPHSFSAGETISSSKMNENFEALKQKLNETQELLNKLISAWPENTILPIGGVDPAEQAFLNKRYFRELKLFYFGSPVFL